MAPDEKVNRGSQLGYIDEWGVPIPDFIDDLNDVIAVNELSLAFGGDPFDDDLPEGNDIKGR